LVFVESGWLERGEGKVWLDSGLGVAFLASAEGMDRMGQYGSHTWR